MAGRPEGWSFSNPDTDRCDRGYRGEQLEADIHKRLLNFGSALMAGEPERRLANVDQLP